MLLVLKWIVDARPLIKRRETSRWSMTEIRHCNKNLLSFYRDRLQEGPVESKYSLVNDYAQLVFSLHMASATIETFFSKCKYVKSRTRMSMKDSTMGDVLHLTQTPLPKDPEHLSSDPVKIDVSAAGSRVENDIDELKEKYLDKHVTRCFIVNDESVLVKGFISSVTWENSVKKFVFHVVYVDGDEEDLYHYEVKSYLNFV